MESGTAMPSGQSAPIVDGRRSRRQFLLDTAGLSLSMAGSVLVPGCASRSLQVGSAVGESPPETTRLRLD
jgi:hypothetical protein